MVKRFCFTGLSLIVVLLFFMVPAGWAKTESADTLYILPFNQGQEPSEVTTGLFDALVDHLYNLGEQRGMRVIIVKRELTEEDVGWFEEKQYLVGELGGYQEEKGCCYTEIKLTGQVQLHLPAGVTLPILEMSDETFFNHDISSPEQARKVVTERLGRKMAEQLLLQIDAI